MTPIVTTNEVSPQPAAADAQREAAITTLIERDLSLLTAHLLLHILEIDRRHAQQAAHPGTHK